MNGFGRTAPVNVGDEIDVKIISLGDKGDGIAKIDGFVIVVPGTQVDDEVRIKVTKVFKNVGFGEVIADTEPSAEPEEAPAEEEQPEEEEPQEEEAEEEPEDTENFGEDLEE